MQNSKHILETSELKKSLPSPEFQNAGEHLNGELNSQNHHRRRHIHKSQEAINLVEDVGYDDFADDIQGDELSSESVDELRERLRKMKKLMENRSKSNNFPSKNSRNYTYVVDGNLLGYIFGFTLLTILAVSIYAFYNLFWAIWKRNARYHEEL